MTDFLAALGAGLDPLSLRGHRVLVAVSGGADSAALLLGLAELRTEWELRLTAAHLDHMLRGEASTADADWVRDLCHRLEVPCLIECQNVPALKAASGLTLEESARQARYEFLKRTAIEQGCTEIATAHTADDQAETVLHHILRGTGITGLRGIPRERLLSHESDHQEAPAHPLRLIRPLLDVRRQEIEAWLALRGQDFREDATNRDPAFTRNRLRHHLLPVLEDNYNPRVIPALLRLQRQADEMDAVLRLFAEEELQAALVEHSPDRCRLRCEELAARPVAFRRVCLTVLWKQQNWPRQRMAFAHWNDLAELIGQKRGGLSLPHGFTARRRRNGLTVERHR